MIKTKIQTKLSVNINKVALIRNSRGHNYPDLVQVAKDIESMGADGITIHPRPDERHAKFDDVAALKAVVKTELNIEGYPHERFMDIVLAQCPDQVTLVPDPPGALTSDHGWDTITHADQLTDIITALRQKGIRTSLFIDPDLKMIEGAAKVGTDRIEFYTGPYAAQYSTNKYRAIEPYVASSLVALDLGLGLNAGHDLNLTNLSFLIEQIPQIAEVSIGHAFTVDAIYYGLENTVKLYKRLLL